jgi:2-oxoglutarate ferredoxin oxidoreductase subunit beta
LNILLFNNQIYGLTKGQFSPTTPFGTITKTSPFGTIENAFNIGELVMGAQGTFFARSLDSNPKLLSELMIEAARHDGTSVIEIMQNCVIYNNKAFDLFSSKETRDDNQIILKHEEPMLFGKNGERGLAFVNGRLKVVEPGKDGIAGKDVLVHDAKNSDSGLHMMLAQMNPPEFPIALGVIRMVSKPTFDDLIEEQIESAKSKSEIKCVDDLLNSGIINEIK